MRNSGISNDVIGILEYGNAMSLWQEFGLSLPDPPFVVAATADVGLGMSTKGGTSLSLLY